MEEFLKKTNIPPAFLVLGLLAVSVVLVAFNFPFSHLLVQFIGVIYPIIKSIGALESETKNDDK